MTVKGLTLKESMNKNIQAIMPLEEEKSEFEIRLSNFIKNLLANKNESEEFQKNLLSDFLKGCLPKNFINTHSRIDLTIYNGQDASSSLGVLIETKSLTNVNEMMTTKNFNVKSFQEAIAYYLEERIVSDAIEIKKIIISNGLSWFVIEAKEFEKYFYNNKTLVDNYKKWSLRQLSSDTTDFLYTSVIAPQIEKAIEKGIRIAHFDLGNAVQSKKDIKLKKNNVTQLYRFFSAENLLNKEIFTDSNKLNKKFYDELLYIMGLEEAKEGTTKIIKRLSPEKRQSFSMIESIITRLDQKDVPVEKQYDTAIQLSVIWINRILFLKLLESQLVAFHNGDRKYKFLSFNKIKSYADLFDLFFGILAKRHDQRNSELEAKYSFIPYLNSSLFEESPVETSSYGITIDQLREGDIKVYGKTVLKDEKGKKKSGLLDFHQYLFEFLESYDFSTTSSGKEKSKNDLINASVLGLIFEKINGYADGSFFTPGNITMYMSRRALRSAAIDKINSDLNWQAKTVEDLKFKISDIETAKKVSDSIDDLKICDPAVGSGHFLVSILNEIIALKNDLGCIFDSEGKILRNIHCYVANDELIVQDFNGDNFNYTVGNFEATRVQKALFQQKQSIIENCLFGVDINPNSANICRLRLWIELLKNSYYDDNGELVTLPNIDINIKIGDSLLHKFDLDFSFDLRRNDFKEYLQLVKDYKQTSNKKLKAELSTNIEKIKRSFTDTASTPEMKRLNNLLTEMGKAGIMDMFADSREEQKRFDEITAQVQKAKKELDEVLKNPMFASGLEWRMEFPEVLDDEGNYVGFDLVIGNPPYIFARNQSFTDDMKKYYVKTYTISEYQANTYTLFIELAYGLLRKGGTFGYIIPNNILTIQTNAKIRKFITEKTGNIVIINSLDKIFSDASVDNCILFFKKKKPNFISLEELSDGEFIPVGKVDSTFFKNNSNFSFSKVKYQKVFDAYEKINQPDMRPLSEISTLKAGVKIYETGKGNPPQTKEDKRNDVFVSTSAVDANWRRWLEGSNIKRYAVSWSGKYVKYGNNLAAKRNPQIFSKRRILVRQIPSRKEYAINAMIIDDDSINGESNLIVSEIKQSLFYVLGVLNSKAISLWFIIKFDKFSRNLYPRLVLNELGQFPIPDVNDVQEREIANNVKLLMNEMAKEESNHKLVDELNIAIDEQVMNAFKLTEEEKQTVRDFEI